MFRCRSMRLANYLLKKNCTMLRIDSLADSAYLAFMFKKDDNLKQALDSWTTDKETFIC